MSTHFTWGNDTETLESAGKQVLEALAAVATLASYLPDTDSPQLEMPIRADRSAGIILTVPLALAGGILGLFVVQTVIGVDACLCCKDKGPLEEPESCDRGQYRQGRSQRRGQF